MPPGSGPGLCPLTPCWALGKPPLPSLSGLGSGAEVHCVAPRCLRPRLERPLSGMYRALRKGTGLPGVYMGGGYRACIIHMGLRKGTGLRGNLSTPQGPPCFTFIPYDQPYACTPLHPGIACTHSHASYECSPHMRALWAVVPPPIPGIACTAALGPAAGWHSDCGASPIPALPGGVLHGASGLEEFLTWPVHDAPPPATWHAHTMFVCDAISTLPQFPSAIGRVDLTVPLSPHRCISPLLPCLSPLICMGSSAGGSWWEFSLPYRPLGACRYPMGKISV